MASVFKKGLKKKKESLFDQELSPEIEQASESSSSDDDEKEVDIKLKKDELPQLAPVNV